jgi:hypothetical protein
MECGLFKEDKSLIAEWEEKMLQQARWMRLKYGLRFSAS